MVPQGSTCAGTVTQAVAKRRLGRSGKLDFAIERVVAVDGSSIPLRYSPTKKEGGSHTVATGALTAGAAVLFWPAAPVFLLIRGKDVSVNRGVEFEVFPDQRFTLSPKAVTIAPAGATTVFPAQPVTTPGPVASARGSAPGAAAAVSIRPTPMGPTSNSMARLWAALPPRYRSRPGLTILR